jgi:hypothetical protein
MKHKGTMTNETMTHVFKHRNWKLKHKNLEKHKNYGMNVFWMDGNNET